ncbi:MAG: FAD-dependent oxidoreductase [Ilumatobacter sp.]|uniref:FAD-dependent oxidoreductase n=1 Tax=Ilumatobacter sp. TaxID=1967498 RepID=UPI00391DB121
MGAQQSDRVGIIGGGSAAEALAAELAGMFDVIVFESDLVGGECPFVACMPSKTMLHDGRVGHSWNDAVEHRRQVTDGLSDERHVEGLRSNGIELVRARASVVDVDTIEADGERYHVDHIVLATGASAVVPSIDGIDDDRGERLDGVWTSEDVYRATIQPDRVVILGAGVIGLETADMFRHFGTDVVVVDPIDRSLATAPPVLGDIVAGALTSRGIDLRWGTEATALRPAERREGQRDQVVVELSDGTSIAADRVVVAVGRTPNTHDLGLESIGIDPDEPLPVDDHGRLRVDGSIWAIGDVAGRGEYTHLASHHALVVADRLRAGAGAGAGSRRFDDVVLSSCMFTTPPFIQVGPSWSELDGDDDVVSVGVDLSSIPRWSTDRLGDGHLWVAARRSTREVIAAAGVGPSFDEIVHAIVVAIDGRVPVARLRHSMQPFPTIGEILGPAWNELHQRLSEAPPNE